jgi:serine protease Do
MTLNDPSTSNAFGNGGRLPARRLILLASVAGLGIAMLLAGPTSFPPSSQAAYAAAEQAPPSFADLVAKVKPAVISVRVKIDGDADTSLNQSGDDNSFAPGSPFNRFFGELPDLRQGHQVITGEGSGFFISANGYAATNYHVVDHAKSVQVTTDDGSIYTARVIGTDPKTDLALIKVDGHKDFPFVTFADQSPRVGDWVVAVGNPFGLGGTVTAGIVSAHGRAIDANSYDDYMQIDAPINKGNSGGPTFDVDGNVVGVNTAIYSPSGGSVGIGFDIPANVAKRVISELKDSGSVTRGQLGVEVQSVTAEIADSLGMKTAEGALVDQAQPGTPAAKAGVQSGDVITAINGTTVKDPGDLARRVAATAPGSTVKLAILRNGEQKNLTVTLGKLSDQQQARAEMNNPEDLHNNSGQLGLSVAPARDYSDTRNGVVVTGIDPDGPAADSGIRTGDIILDVAGKAVSSTADLRDAVRHASSENEHSVLLKVKTGNGTRFVALPIHQG